MKELGYDGWDDKELRASRADQDWECKRVKQELEIREAELDRYLTKINSNTEIFGAEHPSSGKILRAIDDQFHPNDGDIYIRLLTTDFDPCSEASRRSAIITSARVVLSLAEQHAKRSLTKNLLFRELIDSRKITDDSREALAKMNADRKVILRVQVLLEKVLDDAVLGVKKADLLHRLLRSALEIFPEGKTGIELWQLDKTIEIAREAELLLNQKFSLSIPERLAAKDHYKHTAIKQSEALKIFNDLRACSEALACNGIDDLKFETLLSPIYKEVEKRHWWLFW